MHNEPITTLVHTHEQQTINVKHKSKGREIYHKITPRCVIKDETEEFGENLSATLQIKIIREQNWSTRITKDPPSLVYPMYLSLSGSCY